MKSSQRPAASATATPEVVSNNDTYNNYAETVGTWNPGYIVRRSLYDPESIKKPEKRILNDQEKH
jgi:hypothetical protein